MACITQRTAINPTDRSYFDTGFFCTLLGVQHPTCRFFDRLYGALVVVFEKVFGTAPGTAVDAKGLAKSLFKYWVQAAQEDARGVFLLNADLCQVAPNDEPDEITWLDLFQFLRGESDAFFEKTTQWWLYQRAYSVCQCAPLPNSLITPPSQGLPQLPPPINAPLNCRVQELPEREVLIESLEYFQNWLAYRSAQAALELSRLVGEGYQIIGTEPWALGLPFLAPGYTWCVDTQGDPSMFGIAFCKMYGENIVLENPNLMTISGPRREDVFMPSGLDYRVVIWNLFICDPPSLLPYPPLPPDPPDPFCQTFPEFCLTGCSTNSYTLALRTGCTASPQPQIYELPDSSCPTNSYPLGLRISCNAPQFKTYLLPDGNQI